MKKLIIKASGIAAGATGLLMAFGTHAAVDQDVIDAVASNAAYMKENMIAGYTTVLPYFLGVLLLVTLVGWAISKIRGVFGKRR